MRGRVLPADDFAPENGVALLRSCFALALSCAGLFLGFISVAGQSGTLNSFVTGENWAQLSPTTLSEREHATIAFDSVKSQLIVFGGDNSVGVLNDTWMFDGTKWSRLTTQQTSRSRTSAALVYNPDTATFILFGGDTHTVPNGLLNDTWSFDGKGWTQLQPQHQPPARYDAAMAYDPVNHEIVLYGGESDNGFLNDTWTFDGTDWTDRSGAADPPARYGAGMAFDSVSGGAILFGGLGTPPVGSTSPYLGDTWKWSDHQWTQLSPATSPPARWEPAMAENAGGIVLFGGYADTGIPRGPSTRFSDTWLWNGTTWVQSAATGPGPRYGGAMTNHADAVTLIGGCCNSVGGFYTDSWSFDGTAWTRQERTDAPSVRIGAVVVDNTDLHQLILFGGFGGDGFLGDTWIGQRGAWTLVNSSLAPAGRFASSLAYDAQHHTAVLFGGQSGPNSGCSSTPDTLNPNHLCDDTWTFDGQTWVRQIAPMSPPYRSLAAMAFDPDTNQTVLFGGFSDQNTLSDTWTWDGTTWTKQSPSKSPPGEQGASAGLEAAAMAWDAMHHQLILFGGEGNGPNGPKIFNETWMWTGSDWQQLQPTTSPPPVRAASLTFDPVLGGLLLIAGQGSGTGVFGTYSDTWLWDGGTWTKLPPRDAPPPRYFGSAGFDDNLQSTLLFGGGGDDGYVDDTWILTVPPKITAVTRLTDGNIQIHATGVPNVAYAVETSEDFKTFSRTGLATADGTGTVRYEDTNSAGVPQRFYRLAIP